MLIAPDVNLGGVYNIVSECRRHDMCIFGIDIILCYLRYHAYGIMSNNLIITSDLHRRLLACQAYGFINKKDLTEKTNNYIII